MIKISALVIAIVGLAYSIFKESMIGAIGFVLFGVFTLIFRSIIKSEVGTALPSDISRNEVLSASCQSTGGFSVKREDISADAGMNFAQNSVSASIATISDLVSCTPTEIAEIGETAKFKSQIKSLVQKLKFLQLANGRKSKTVGLLQDKKGMFRKKVFFEFNNLFQELTKKVKSFEGLKKVDGILTKSVGKHTEEHRNLSEKFHDDDLSKSEGRIQDFKGIYAQRQPSLVELQLPEAIKLTDLKSQIISLTQQVSILELESIRLNKLGSQLHLEIAELNSANFVKFSGLFKQLIEKVNPKDQQVDETLKGEVEKTMGILWNVWAEIKVEKLQSRGNRVIKEEPDLEAEISSLS
jgi:hypothetical protein